MSQVNLIELAGDTSSNLNIFGTNQREKARIALERQQMKQNEKLAQDQLKLEQEKVESAEKIAAESNATRIRQQNLVNQGFDRKRESDERMASERLESTEKIAEDRNAITEQQMALETKQVDLINDLQKQKDAAARAGRQASLEIGSRDKAAFEKLDTEHRELQKNLARSNTALELARLESASGLEKALDMVVTVQQGNIAAANEGQLSGRRSGAVLAGFLAKTDLKKSVTTGTTTRKGGFQGSIKRDATAQELAGQLVEPLLPQSIVDELNSQSGGKGGDAIKNILDMALQRAAGGEASDDALTPNIHKELLAAVEEFDNASYVSGFLEGLASELQGIQTMTDQELAGRKPGAETSLRRDRDAVNTMTKAVNDLLQDKKVLGIYDDDNPEEDFYSALGLAALMDPDANPGGGTPETREAFALSVDTWFLSKGIRDSAKRTRLTKQIVGPTWRMIQSSKKKTSIVNRQIDLTGERDALIGQQELDLLEASTQFDADNPFPGG